MSIKGRIVSFQVIITLAVLSMALATYFAIHNSNDQFERMKQSRQQLEAVTRLAVQINRFSEQIAELLLLGDAERPDFETARADTEAAFEALRRFALAEREAFPSRADDEENGDLASRVEAMYALFREIDRAAERVLLLDGENRRADAIELFRTEIENKLDADLERLVLVASAGENAKVARADADAQALTYGIMGATLALLITLLVITLGRAICSRDRWGCRLQRYRRGRSRSVAAICITASTTTSPTSSDSSPGASTRWPRSCSSREPRSSPHSAISSMK
jgi:two-component system OmpR family sensor kinase